MLWAGFFFHVSFKPKCSNVVLGENIAKSEQVELNIDVTIAKKTI